MNEHGRFDVAAVKQAAAGRWAEILAKVGGIAPEVLDGQHHPCPKCGGVDRFRLIDQDAGACLCNQCFNKGNGDGIAAVRWLCGWNFSTALREIGSYLGLNGQPAGKPRIVATYDYRDEAGELLFQVVRYRPKHFRQRRPKPGGGWIPNVKGVRVVPYRLPELLKADPKAIVFVPEGEKDCDRLHSLGLVATTNAGGAEKWKPEHARFLDGRHVVVLPDNDGPGRKHARQVAQTFVGKAASLKVLELLRLVEEAEEWQPATEAEAPPPDESEGEPRFRVYGMAELAALDLRIDCIFHRALVVDTPGVIGGREKSLKTSIGLDCAISMATFTPWLGYFKPVRAAKVMYFAGEGGLTCLRDAARRIADSKKFALEDVTGFFICDDVPNLDSDGDMDAVTRSLRDYEVEFAFFDPLYLMMAGEASNASNVYAMGAMLRRMLWACRRAGATPIVLHHFKKSQPTGEAPELSDLSQAGCGEFAGQWLLINRQRAYDEEQPGEHDLIVCFGSRVGFSSKWVLHVSEGSPDAPSGRHWKVGVSRPGDAGEREKEQKKAAKAQREAEQTETFARKIVQTLGRLKVPATKTRLKDESGLRDAEIRCGLSWALERGNIVPGEVFISNHKTPKAGYKLPECEA